MIDSRTYGQLKRLPVFQRLFAQTPVQSNLPPFSMAKTVQASAMAIKMGHPIVWSLVANMLMA